MGSIFFDCDGRLTLIYDKILEIVNLYGDAAISRSGDEFILGLDINEFHTFRFESLNGMDYAVSVDGLDFIDQFTVEQLSVSAVQLFGGGCDSTRPPEVVNEWDFVRYGTISFGEKIVSTDPPAGVLDEITYSNLDRFTVTFDSANYVYIDDITVEIIDPTANVASAGQSSTVASDSGIKGLRDEGTTEAARQEGKESAVYTLQEAIALRDSLGLQGPISSRSLDPSQTGPHSGPYHLSDGATAASPVPVVIATRRLDNDEPDTVEIVLDQPMPVGQITRFTFDDGTTTNVVDYAIGLPDSDGDGVTDFLDQCPGEDDTIDGNNNGTPDCLDAPVPAVSAWGLLILALLIVASGTVAARRRTWRRPGAPGLDHASRHDPPRSPLLRGEAACVGRRVCRVDDPTYALDHASRPIHLSFLCASATLW